MLTVAVIAAIISYRHAYELVRSHGESGATACLVLFTVDGLIWAASMVILDCNRRNRPVPPLAAWSLGVGIVATIGANLAHGLDHGPIGALVGARPAVALVGSYELCMLVIRPVQTRPGLLWNGPSGLRVHLGPSWRCLRQPIPQRWNRWFRRGTRRAAANERSRANSVSIAVG